MLLYFGVWQLEQTEEQISRYHSHGDAMSSNTCRLSLVRFNETWNAACRDFCWLQVVSSSKYLREYYNFIFSNVIFYLFFLYSDILYIICSCPPPSEQCFNNLSYWKKVKLVFFRNSLYDYWLSIEYCHFANYVFYSLLNINI